VVLIIVGQFAVANAPFLLNVSAIFTLTNGTFSISRREAKMHLYLVFLALTWLNSAVMPSPATQSTSTYITHVTVIDTKSGKELHNQTVTISGNLISGVQNSNAVAVPPEARVIDGSGKYLIPGLWDMHVHGTQYDSTLPLYIANGVTGVREMFGPPNANKFRAELASKGIVAPHINLASPIVDGNPPIWPNAIKVETAAEARRVVDEQKQRGADFIKVYTRLSREAYFAILDEAKRMNIPVEGHVPIRVTAWEATAAKQKSIEHSMGIPFACSTRENELWRKAATTKSMLEVVNVEVQAWRSYSHKKCTRLFEEFKRNQTWQVPTLTVYSTIALLNETQFRNDTRIRYFGGEFRRRLDAKNDPGLKSLTTADFEVERELFTHEKEIVGEMFRAGVPILAGTDTGNPYCFPGFSLHDELSFLVEAGMSPLAALQAATWNAAVFMNASDRYGSIERGKVADLVLLNADPLQDIHNTTKILEVFEQGREFDRVALETILKDALRNANSTTAN
jgi:Amidohydrolase family